MQLNRQKMSEKLGKSLDEIIELEKSKGGKSKHSRGEGFKSSYSRGSGGFRGSGRGGGRGGSGDSFRGRSRGGSNYQSGGRGYKSGGDGFWRQERKFVQPVKVIKKSEVVRLGSRR